MKKQYFCTVFFMVLDLRLSKDWVVGMTILLFYSGGKNKDLLQLASQTVNKNETDKSCKSGVKILFC